MDDLVVSYFIKFDFERLDAFWIEGTRGKTEICEFDVATRVNEEVLWLEVTMDVTKLVQLADRGEHFADIESCVLLLQNTRVIQ